MSLYTACIYSDTFCRSTVVAATVVILAATLISEANSSSCNGYDSYHDFECSAGHSIYRISGRHDNGKEDRIYCYNCRDSGTASHCYRTGYVNSWDKPVVKLCNPNYYIAGVRSYHSNSHEDRRFDYKCCKNSNKCTRNCYLKRVNSFDGSMDYSLAANRVFVGAFSWHDNRRE